MQIEIADINSIKPYVNNPRKLSDTAIEKVAMSLKEYGFRQPIVVDKDRVIVAGHTRFRASKKLGLKNVPISIIDNLTDKEPEKLTPIEREQLLDMQLKKYGKEGRKPKMSGGMLDDDMSRLGLDEGGMLPDENMEDNYMEFIMAEALSEEE